MKKSPPPSSATTQLDLAPLMELYTSGQHEKLEGLLTDFCKKHPEHLQTGNLLGATLMAQRKFEAAATCYKNLIKTAPEAVEMHCNLGIALKGTGDIIGAINSYKAAIKCDPKHIDSHYNLGIAYQEFGKYDDAQASFENALKLNPKHVNALNNLGGVLKTQGDLEAATMAIERALVLAPKHPEAHYNHYALLLDPENMTPAIESLEKAVRFSNGYGSYHLNLGVSYEYNGQTEKAAPHFAALENKADTLNKARLDAWRYLQDQTPHPRIFGTNIDAFKMGLSAARQDGLVLEFGVRFGNSIRQIANLTDTEIHGFDSFEGLPEDWHDTAKEVYSTRGELPPVPDHVHLHQGWFEDTLPAFLKDHTQPVKFINIDCDIYSSTKTVLDGLASQITSGTIIVFDEYIGNLNWRKDEYKAFQEAVKTYGWSYEYLGFSFVTKQVVVKII